MLAHVVKRFRRALKRVHAAIAAAKLRRLRNELICRGGPAATASSAPDDARQPRTPLILGDKWDF